MFETHKYDLESEKIALSEKEKEEYFDKKHNDEVTVQKNQETLERIETGRELSGYYNPIE